MIFSQIWRVALIVVMLGGGVWAAVSGHLMIGLAMHGAMVGFLLAGTLNPASKLFGKVRTYGGKGIWLTLDDGPDPETTPAVLDLLDAHGAKATFFLIGERAAKYPELVREIHRRGHGIGNHSWSHPRAIFWCLGPLRTWREISRCQQVLTEITGEAPQWFRAPVGHYNFFVHPVLKQEGLGLLSWSSRGFDGGGLPLEDVKRRIRETADEGGIVLAHEGTPYAVEVVADVLALAQERGWECVIPDASPR
ncbi:MAG: polysaccharide deacetylase family protein [Luteolibacter sp.]